jgi:surface carbohydrate biosynthesis protein
MNDSNRQPISPRPPAGILYLPVEVSVRELESRLLLAAVACEAGMEVVLGQKWLLQKNIPQMPPGVLLFKTLTNRDALAMREAHAHGYRTAAIDEEAPGIDPRTGGLRWVSADALAQSDVIFALGEDHRDALAEKYPQQAAKLEIVGNPRWDLLRPEFRAAHAGEAAAIRKEFGPFILINTNFGLTNSAKGPPEAVVRALVRGGKLDMNKPDDANLINECRRVEALLMSEIGGLLRRLHDAFPGHRIVVRPHPNEVLDTWRKIIGDLPRVALERRGAAIPWILASDVLIHPYCTTGVEAFALDKPAICFKPTETPLYDIYLSSSINFLAHDVEELVTEVARIVSQPPGAFEYPQVLRDRFDHAFAAHHGALSAELIVRRLAILAASAGAKPWEPAAGFQRWMWLKHHKDALMPRVAPEQLLEKLQRLQTQLHREQNFAITQMGDRLFHIAAAAGASRIDDRSGTPPLWLRAHPRYTEAARAAH